MTERFEPCPTCGHPRKVIDGAMLREWRLRKRLTLSEASDRLGLSAAFLCDLEHNRRNRDSDGAKKYIALVKPER